MFFGYIFRINLSPSLSITSVIISSSMFMYRGLAHVDLRLVCQKSSQTIVAKTNLYARNEIYASNEYSTMYIHTYIIIMARLLQDKVVSFCACALALNLEL